MILSGRYHVPDTCPERCPFINDFYFHGFNAVCGYCPIFTCRRPIHHKERGRLVSPEDYREDWAQKWCQWFQGDMKTMPLPAIQHLTSRTFFD